MAKKHLAAVSLLIVLIFGLTSCVCRSSDTAISMPVYDKPASATANTRTMQDETVTKSSSENPPKQPRNPLRVKMRPL